MMAMVKSLLDKHLQSLHRTCSSQQDASSSLFTCDVQTFVHLDRGYYAGVVSIGRKHPIMRFEQVLLEDYDCDDCVEIMMMMLIRPNHPIDRVDER